MSGVQVDNASMVKIARQMGEAGKPAPSWVHDDPAYRAAYEQGAGRSPVPFHPPAPRPSSPRPARTRPARKAPATRRRPYIARAFSPTAAAGRLGVPEAAGNVKRAGDAGGLLLAFVLYPVALATLKYGAAGPGIWFRAKWLNQATGTPAAGSSSGKAPAATPAPSTGRRPGAPDGMPLPVWGPTPPTSRKSGAPQ